MQHIHDSCIQQLDFCSPIMLLKLLTVFGFVKWIQIVSLLREKQQVWTIKVNIKFKKKRLKYYNETGIKQTSGLNSSPKTQRLHLKREIFTSESHIWPAGDIVICALVVYQFGVHPFTGRGAAGGRHVWGGRREEKFRS